MKIINRPEITKTVRVTCKYPKCRAVYEIEQGDDLVYIPDSRDGNFYTYLCPVCHKQNEIAATLIPWEA